jgi:hypothetical protein
MKKIIILLIASMLINSDLFAKNLTKFDGEKNEILGFMGIPVDKNFFSKDTTYYNDSSNIYHSFFKVESNISDLSIRLTNQLKNGNGYPIVISIYLPKNKFKNYIIPFDENPELSIDIADELRILNKSVQKEFDNSDLKSNNKNSYTYTINIISSIPFEGDYVIDNNTESLNVFKPQEDYNSSAITPMSINNNTVNGCCLTTNPEKIGVIAINYQGIATSGWMKIARTNCSGVWQKTCNIELTCYYPTMADVFHYPDTERISQCFYTIAGGPVSCNINPICCGYTSNVQYTKRGYGTNLVKHEWIHMDWVVDNNGYSGTCRQYYGSGAGETWRIQRYYP